MTDSQDFEMAPDEPVKLHVVNGIGTLRLDRPKLNALNSFMQRRIGELAEECVQRDDIFAVVITGGERVFAAGADIKEMIDMSYADMVAHSGVLEALHN